MKGWYRVLVIVIALAAAACTLTAGYAGVKMLSAGEQLLSNEVLLREISEWWEGKTE